MKALVLFGSTSDESVYGPLNEQIRAAGIEVKFEVISAHRNPDELATCLNESEYDVVIGGAGLAAHLPGVISSKIYKPVIGIPVASRLAGLDAYLSIVQMPYSCPVGTSYPEDTKSVVKFLKNVKEKNASKIHITFADNSPEYQSEIERTEKIAKALDVEYSMSDTIDADAFNLVMVSRPMEEDLLKDNLGVYIPFLSTEAKKSAMGALDMFHLANTGGLWIGAHNLRNALLFSMQVIKTNDYENALKKARSGEVK